MVQNSLMQKGKILATETGENRGEEARGGKKKLGVLLRTFLA